ncbi:MAG: hypothetical protein AVDCRST_MAG88-480, partial [uncultured Thermomicrobiales bacterium]
MGMSLSYSTWGMPRVPIEVAVAHCARLGFDGLELTVIPGWVTDAAGLDTAARRRIRALYDEHGIALCGLSGNTPLLAGSRDEHARNRELLRGYFELAAELQRPGERLTVTTTSCGSPEDWEGARGLLADRFGELADDAGRAGVVVGVEPHVGAAIHAPEQALWLLEQVRSPALTIHFDISH